jgi:hypothetical protein
MDANIAAFADTSGAGANGGTFVFSWGNSLQGVTLSKSLGAHARIPGLGWSLGDSASVEQRFSLSRFSTELNLGAGSLRLTNNVTDARVSGALNTSARGHDRSIGYDVAAYGIRYSAASELADANFYDLRQKPTSVALYYDDIWRVSPRLIVQTGARGEALTGRRWAAFSPRVSAKAFLTPDWALTAAAQSMAVIIERGMLLICATLPFGTGDYLPKRTVAGASVPRWNVVRPFSMRVSKCSGT